MFHFHPYLCLSLMDWATHSSTYFGPRGNPSFPLIIGPTSVQWPVALRVFYWPNYTTNSTLDGSTSSLHVPSIASAKRSMLSILHSVEDPQPVTSRVSTCWADPTGSASTLNLQKRPSMGTIVRNCAPATLQFAPANVWPSESIWAILVAAPDVTLGHGPPNQTCQHPSVPRSVKSFAATLSCGTESGS